MNDRSFERRRLPEVHRHLMWHNQSGLVVSPYSRTLPIHTSSPSPRQPKGDPNATCFLSDSEIYMAYYPKKAIHHGPIFSVLAVTPSELKKAAIHVPGTHSSFVLEQGFMNRWIALEDSLHDVIFYLMAKHPKAHLFPKISWPLWPMQQGYRDVHQTQELTIVCARRAIWAFRVMSACTTFALSLWLGEFEDNCFQNAFVRLATRALDPISRSWLHLLQESVVGDLSPGLRPGAFLDPYATRWGPYLVYFCRASVPIWFIWGHGVKDIQAQDAHMLVEFYPPDDYIEIAQRRVAQYDSIVLPTRRTYKFEGTISSIPSSGAPITLPDDPSDLMRGNARWDDEELPPPPVDRRMIVNPLSGQKPGEDWETFKARKEKAQQHRIQVETPTEKQSRESREAYATKSGPSKTSTVYVWEKDEEDPTVYRRTIVTKAEADFEFMDTHAWGRFYWSYCNEWDLVHHLPPPPGEKHPEKYGINRDPYGYDDDYDDIIPPPFPEHLKDIPVLRLPEQSNDIPVAPLPAQSKDVRDAMFKPAVEAAPPMPYTLSILSVVEYLRRRHGFDLLLQGSSWNPQVHGGKYAQQREKHLEVLKFLLYSQEALPPLALRALVDFYNTSGNYTLSYRQLPPSWDISRKLEAPSFICDLSRVRLQRIDQDASTVYILRPPAKSDDPSPWYVALWSATAVLLVYRRGWATMLEIARGLLELAIPFRTVIETDTLPPKSLWRSKSTGLGFRTITYQPDDNDYNAYLLARENVFSSSRGRVLRMLGGIVWRLASGHVSDSTVLDGPSSCDQVIAQHGDKYFLDDGISEEILDIVSGVYHIPDATNKGTVTHASWWPKHLIWKSSGLYGDQWSPAAENFYQLRLQDFEKKALDIKGSKKWKEKVKHYETKTVAWIRGSEQLAAEFLRLSSRVV